MLKKLRLERFKNFKDAEFHLGPLTILVGANATGKSNIREAFRFLHGLSRGYYITEIIGEKYGEGGELQWTGLRGGCSELTFQGAETFALEVVFSFESDGTQQEASYQIEISTGSIEKDPDSNLVRSLTVPHVVSEKLTITGQNEHVFTAFTEGGFLHLKIRGADTPTPNNSGIANFLSFVEGPSEKDFPFDYSKQKYSELISNPADQQAIRATIYTLRSMRFFDLHPEAMRKPSVAGQTVLGSHGENLSSVLYKICEKPQRKQALIQWVQELTPMDAKNFEFPVDLTGKILLSLIEENGQKVSAYSASDGTLRFLAMLAVLLGPEQAKFYFLEELENDIHPTRLHLLLQLIEHQVGANMQMVATTHSPQLLRLLNPDALEYASLLYRLPDRPDAQIKRIVDIPDARQVIEEQDLARLHESGWLEDAMFFLTDEEAAA